MKRLEFERTSQDKIRNIADRVQMLKFELLKQENVLDLPDGLFSCLDSAEDRLLDAISLLDKAKSEN